MLPRDEAAERALLGCLLLGAQPDFAPVVISSHLRRRIACTIDLLRNTDWTGPETLHPRDVDAAVQVNAQRTLNALNQLWPADASRHLGELVAAYEAALWPEEAEIHVRRLTDIYQRCRQILHLERELAAIRQDDFRFQLREPYAFPQR
ncbi:hypothetical protein Mal4_35280 [Maioricimonas rarisocia]|uniref:Uncharacterized protein n=1 Tax=Maioricimonas rarisocia TaxID=2528026 RepID=A0A517Z9S7_9PLAN|nr:hypothetical protein [Maioricimonas rarisocia]QDU39191.1 hypothetical protein Mal4_35280 [Maioricimonas rarisocia]